MANNISDIIIGTESYENVKLENTVSITGDGGNAWGYFGPSYKKLAPILVTYKKYEEKLEDLNKLKEDINNLRVYYEYRKKIEDEYIQSYYETRLKDLDVFELLEKLEQKFGRKIILLCHKSPKEFCHRMIDADYIELKTDIYIPEISVDQFGNVKKIEPIRYKNRLKKYI